MARIQILELPTEEQPDGRHVTPFALILDQCSDFVGIDPEAFTDFRERCGARALLVFEDTVDIPGRTATETAAAAGTSLGKVRVTVEPDLAGFGDQVAAAVADANKRLSEALGTGRG